MRIERRPVIAIGPELDRPTWSWVGFNLLRELSKYYCVKPFRQEERPVADIIVSVKDPALALAHTNVPIVYLPCDFYTSYEQMAGDVFLRFVKAVVCHSDSLASAMSRLHANVHIIEHDSKYVLPTISGYRAEGPIMWVGFSEHLRYLGEWLLDNPLDEKLIVLTDKPNAMSLPGAVTRLSWTPKRQRDLMQSARAALDIKGSDFNQSMRPPEKLQIYIASGIPSACNLSAETFSYFRRNGFEVADANDTHRWFSREYHAETCRFAEVLRRKMSLESIGLQMKEIIDALL